MSGVVRSLDGAALASSVLNEVRARTLDEVRAPGFCMGRAGIAREACHGVAATLLADAGFIVNAKL